jgi:2',3'-cyclic-nucleotide 2'-phosphodiesterase (5'-nucleotidase family)
MNAAIDHFPYEDIDGCVEGLPHIATLVEQIRTKNPDVPALFFDIGDIEETSMRLGNLSWALDTPIAESGWI